MTWVKLDDGFHENDKQLRMSDAAVRVWVCSMTKCAREATPTGFLTKAQALALVRSLGKKESVIAELVELNGWEELPDGYLVHDFEVYVPKSSADRVRRWREAKRRGEDPDPEPLAEVPNGTPGNADVTRYAASPKRSVTRDSAAGDAPVTEAASRASARPRRGYPVPRIPVPVVPPTSELSPLTPSESVGDLIEDFEVFIQGLSASTGVAWRGDHLSRTAYLDRRREGFTAEGLLAAARGVALDPWAMGRNADGIPRNDPASVLKSSKLQTYIALGRGQIVPRPSTVAGHPSRIDAEHAAADARVAELMGATDDEPAQPFALRALPGGRS